MFARRVPPDQLRAVIRLCREQGISVRQEPGGFRLADIDIVLEPPAQPGSGTLWTARGPDGQADRFAALMADAADGLEDYEP